MSSDLLSESLFLAAYSLVSLSLMQQAKRMANSTGMTPNRKGTPTNSLFCKDQEGDMVVPAVKLNRCIQVREGTLLAGI